MEELVIELGPKSRRLKLTAADGAVLQRRFNFESPSTWLMEAVLGIVPSAADNSAGNLDAQASTLALAINRAAGTSSKVTELQVLDWIQTLQDEVFEEKRPANSLKVILWTLFRAAHRSGWPQQKPVDPDVTMEQVRRLFFAEKVEDVLESKAPTGSETTEAPSTPPSSQQPSSVRAADSP